MENNAEQMLELRKQLREQIQFRDMILKLYKNKEFINVILDGFMVKDCARQVRASVSEINADSRAKALGSAQAAGYLQEYLRVNVLMGNNAEKELAAMDNDNFEPEE